MHFHRNRKNWSKIVFARKTQIFVIENTSHSFITKTEWPLRWFCLYSLCVQPKFLQLFDGALVCFRIGIECLQNGVPALSQLGLFMLGISSMSNVDNMLIFLEQTVKSALFFFRKSRSLRITHCRAHRCAQLIHVFFHTNRRLFRFYIPTSFIHEHLYMNIQNKKWIDARKALKLVSSRVSCQWNSIGSATSIQLLQCLCRLGIVF